MTEVFNPDAVYVVPPEGALVPDLCAEQTDGTTRRTGPIWVTPGTVLIYDAELVKDDP